MKVTKDTTIREISSAFTEQFKGLKLMFFNKSHDISEGSPQKDMITDDVTLNKLSADFTSSSINWNKEMTVGELEQLFETDFGLHVQVFRLTGRNWLETTTTDSYTLDEQMKKSAESQLSIR